MRHPLSLAAAFGVAALILAGCGGGSTETAAAPVVGGSGVQGLVTHVVHGGAPPPPGVILPPPVPQPFPGAIITVQPQGGGPEIARAVSDAQGRYQISLSPGNFLLVPLPAANSSANAPSVPVVVPASLTIDQPIQYVTNAP